MNSKKTIDQTTVQHKLDTEGFIHLPVGSFNELEKLLSNLGKILLKTEIREDSQSRRLLSSNNSMEPHTDHHHAKYIAWFCHSQSATGGESILIDSSEILKTITSDTLDLLTQVTVKSHHVFYDDKLNYPLINLANQKGRVYYSSWLINEPACHRRINAIQKFEELVNKSIPIKILISEGDVLLIDNHRMLHGRNGFPTNSNRWLTRYWISDKQNPYNK